MSTPKFAVGDTVIVTSVNRGRGYEGTVAKVGRKLVTVTNAWGQPDVFRIDTGSRNDLYGHEAVWTVAEHAAKEERAELVERIKGHGIQFGYGMAPIFANDALARLANLLDEIDPSRADDGADS